MKTWDQFLKDVLPDVAGCPEPVAEHAILRAAQQFCAAAHVWKLWLDNVATLATSTDYDIALEPNSELVKLERATLDGRDITITTTESLPSDWKTNTAGIANCLFTQNRKTMTLLPAQAAGLILRVEAVLKPSNAATGIDDAIFDQYVETIAMGAKARLMKQAGKPYSNPVAGFALETQFMNALAGVDFQRWRGASSARPRSRLQTF